MPQITGNASTSVPIKLPASRVSTPDSVQNPTSSDSDAPAGKYEQVQPLLRFFELVHVADLMQQMVHVYYKQEIVSIFRACALILRPVKSAGSSTSMIL